MDDLPRACLIENSFYSEKIDEIAQHLRLVHLLGDLHIISNQGTPFFDRGCAQASFFFLFKLTRDKIASAASMTFL